MVENEHAPWERQDGEPTKAYEAFRRFRDLPTLSRNFDTVSEQVKLPRTRIQAWASEWSWIERASQWDDACHQIEDQERLEAIREMHSVHRHAGRVAITKALEVLGDMQPEQISAAAAARLLELGAKLERSTLIVSVEELQGIDTEEVSEDPWDRIARELDPNHAPQN